MCEGSLIIPNMFCRYLLKSIFLNSNYNFKLFQTNHFRGFEFKVQLVGFLISIVLGILVLYKISSAPASGIS